MGGFAGFAGYRESLTEEKYLWRSLARRMAGRISHRGPDDRGAHVSAHCALAHVRLAVIDPENGAQPMTIRRGDREYTIAYHGEITNASELRRDLEALGCTFQTRCDTEVLLNAYLCFGQDCVQKLNGVFAFAIDDELRRRTFLCRDRFGAAPLFYSLQGERLVFASEIKGLFEYPGLTPVIDREGICEIFGLGPARTPGCGVFRDIHELKPGHFALYNRDGFSQHPYFCLAAHPHGDDYETTVHTVRDLLLDSVERRLISDVPLCAFLSGDLNSAILTAIASRYFKEQGRELSTYSLDFGDSEEDFAPPSQPDWDGDQAQKQSCLLGTNHEILPCSGRDLLHSLPEAVIARDLPGMAPMDGALLHVCRRAKEKHGVALSGAGADEIFGDYPRFHHSGLFDGTAFPWLGDLATRRALLKPELEKELCLQSYVSQRMQETLEEIPSLRGESREQRRIRQISYFSIKWFMSTLLDRNDRCGMAAGLEIRVPYADHRLVQYVFNTPWEYRCPQGVAKGLLRDACKEFLPEEALFRRKPPRPQGDSPRWEALLREKLNSVLADSAQPIHKLLSEEAASSLLSGRFDCGKPGSGQWMAGSQLLAYLLQTNYWLLHYNVYIDL